MKGRYADGTHEELVKKMPDEPAVRSEYDAQAEGIRPAENSAGGDSAGLTQAEVAARGHQDARRGSLGGRGGSQAPLMSIATLRRYAEAVGCRLEIDCGRQGDRRMPNP
jgi:hypothetical protein